MVTNTPLTEETPDPDLSEGPEVPTLTTREHQVLRLLAAGMTTPRIAEELGISRTTVKAHLAGAADKLGPRRQAGIVGKAIALGLL